MIPRGTEDTQRPHHLIVKHIWELLGSHHEIKSRFCKPILQMCRIQVTGIKKNDTAPSINLTEPQAQNFFTDDNRYQNCVLWRLATTSTMEKQLQRSRKI